jgi:hypothetical protein
MKRSLLGFTLLICALSLNGEEIIRLTFDGAEIGNDADARAHVAGTYTPGAQETLPGSSTVIARYFNPLGNDGPPPRIIDAEEFLTGAPDGGGALVVESGRQSQGLQILLSGPIPPGDVTIEIVFMATDLEPAGNPFKFMYLGSNEWPNGGKFMWAFRRAGDQSLNFVAFGDGSGNAEIRLPVNSPIESGRWYHVAGVLDYNNEQPAESTLRFFLDGALQAEAPYNASQDQWSLGSSNNRHANSFAIGYSNGQDANPYDSRGMSGAIDAFSVSTDALNPDTFRLPLPR